MENELMEIASKVAVDRSKDLYDDGLKPVTKETGQVLGTIVGLFNHVVLYPIKKANISFQYKLEQFEKDLENKTKGIPDDKLVAPPLNIAGPIMESLKYTFDTKELRDMYLNLLSSSMNSDMIEYSHPSYVEIIKQMSPLDAKLFKQMVSINQIPCVDAKVNLKDKFFNNLLPKKFIPDLIDNDDPFLISASADNLLRLGLINHLTESYITNYDYDKVKDHPFIQSRYNSIKQLYPENELILNINKEVLSITNFGQNFAKTCLD